MTDQPPLQIIARMHSDFPEKFGIPRQSGMVGSLRSAVIFEPMFRNPDALRGLDKFSHIWLLWGFSKARMEKWSPTVRPPRLGGNTRVGVFATRSPFRPNSIGLSSVKLEEIEQHSTLGPVLHVSGSDLMDTTPIFDIKPYLPYTDCHPDATNGFAGSIARELLKVEIPAQWKRLIPEEQLESINGLLAQDPRPSYQDDNGRTYGMSYAGLNIRFTVQGNTLTVCEIAPTGKPSG